MAQSQGPTSRRGPYRRRQNQFRENAGVLIRQARIKAGMTLKELASAAGVSYQRIQQYEAGVAEVPIDRLDRIAAAIGRHVTDFSELP